jgi:hypothetical protein
VLARPSSNCKRQTPSSRQIGCYIRTITAGVQLKKENIGRGSQGAWRQDEVIDGKLVVAK